jgi:hypothetical protein
MLGDEEKMQNTLGNGGEYREYRIEKTTSEGLSRDASTRN